MAKMILNMSMSVDGFIATESGDGEFALKTLQQDSQFDNFYQSVDSIVMGRKTYDYLKQAAPKMLKDKHIFVITHYLRQQEDNIVFIHEDIVGTLTTLKQNASKNIWVMGGAQVANILIKENLIDKIILNTAPVLLGNGIRLFDDERKLQSLKLEESRTFDGCVQNRYTFA
ncbi:MAG: dihydrofolate reductase family protein [Alphaproteobacteria bacterium]